VSSPSAPNGLAKARTIKATETAASMDATALRAGIFDKRNNARNNCELGKLSSGSFSEKK